MIDPLPLARSRLSVKTNSTSKGIVCSMSLIVISVVSVVIVGDIPFMRGILCKGMVITAGPLKYVATSLSLLSLSVVSVLRSIRASPERVLLSCSETAPVTPDVVPVITLVSFSRNCFCAT